MGRRGIADGRYGIVLTARNALGVVTTATLAVIVDRTLAGFKVSPQVFSPNGDGRLDRTRFKFTLYNPARVTLTVRRGKKTVGQVSSGALQPGPQFDRVERPLRPRRSESTSSRPTSA